MKKCFLEIFVLFFGLFFLVGCERNSLVHNSNKTKIEGIKLALSNGSLGEISVRKFEAKDFPRVTKNLYDGWGNSFMIRELSSSRYEIRSAGEDREFFSKDDIFDVYLNSQGRLVLRSVPVEKQGKDKQIDK